MSYTAVVRRKLGPTVTMKIRFASGIREASEIVRAKHGFYTEDPHDGYTINQSLTSKARIQDDS